ncbi:MAG: hypothetical protein ACXVCP_13970 [Bdellovibrio sp.]
MQKMLLVTIILVAQSAIAKTVAGPHRNPAQSAMELEGTISMTSYPNQLAIEIDGEKASQLFERVAKNKKGKEISTNAKVWCDTNKSCSIYWNQ